MRRRPQWPTPRTVRRLGPRFAFRSRSGRAPLSIRAQTSDAEVFRQVVVGRELEFEFDVAPCRIIDAGANIGIGVRVFAERWPQASIIAIELEAANFGLLERNSSPYPLVTVKHGGLWSKKGHLVLVNPDADAWAFAAAESSRGAAGTIPSFGVEDLLDEAGWDTCDLLKLDIEGGEIAVFDASHRWIDRCRRIAVELHDRFTPGCREAMNRAIRRSMERLTARRVCRRGAESMARDEDARR